MASGRSGWGQATQWLIGQKAESKASEEAESTGLGVESRAEDRAGEGGQRDTWRDALIIYGTLARKFYPH